jgi:hypothetical protein
MLITGGAFAQDVQVVGTVTQAIPVEGVSAMTSSKHISLLNFALSKNAQKSLKLRLHRALVQKDLSSRKNIPHAIQLGMGNVPVFDQGSYGTCVTFSTTAALDAVIGRGDYISQLCSLQLGNYLQTNGYNPSGWDGSSGATVLGQLTAFGYVNKMQQVHNGCGGLTDYPGSSFDPSPQTPTTVITPDEFHTISEALDPSVVSWSAILDSYEAMSDGIDFNALVAEIKTILSKGDRITFGVLLPDTNLGVSGAVGKYKAQSDSWVLTTQIAQDAQDMSNLPGHEMIITGYDDNAVAIDKDGKKYKGLFTLRNSWSDEVGYKGNFYMSYAYFQALVIEANRIRNLKSNHAQA